MAHQTVKSGYAALTDRLNRFPQGAPPSELLFKILRMLFSENEAGLVSSLPIRPFTAKKAALIWKKPESEARKILDSLADRGLLVDNERNGRSVYSLPPPMAGFFEFSMMRVRQDIDQKLLARAPLPVSERGGGLHQGSLRERRNPARTGIRSRARPALRSFA